MQTLHTAAIHRLLTTPVALDLGATTGALADISKQLLKLDGLRDGTAALPQHFTDLTGHVSTSAAQLKTDFRDALDKAVEEIVERVGNPAEPAEWEIGSTAQPLVRLLVQAQALAIVREPGSTEGRGDENSALKKLSNAAKREAEKVIDDQDQALHDRFIAAFEPFTSTELPYRSERFVEMHALTEAIALHFDGQ